MTYVNYYGKKGKKKKKNWNQNFLISKKINFFFFPHDCSFKLIVI